MSGLNNPLYVEAVEHKSRAEPRDIEMGLARQTIEAARPPRRWTVGLLVRLGRFRAVAWARRPWVARPQE